MKLSITGLCMSTCVASVLTASVVHADTVQIESRDGSIKIIGDLVEFDGASYSIATSLGTMKIDANTVICTGDACPITDAKFSDFAMVGSRVLTDKLMPQLLADYAFHHDAKNSVVTQGNGTNVFLLESDISGSGEIRVASADTEAGLAAIENGQAAIALASRSANKNEIDGFESKSLGNLKSIEQENIVALDALVIVTHNSNPVRSISEADVARVFSGQITNWQELGGANQPIVLYGREAGTGTTEMFEDLVMEPSGLSLTRSIKTLDTGAAVSDAVWLDAGGIGFTNFADLGNARPLDIEEECGLRTPATTFSIKSEEYPYSQVLYAYRTNTEFDANVADFVDFITSDNGQLAVKNSGFVDQNITSESVNGHGFRLATAVATSESSQDLNALQNMLQTLQTAERLSTTFRFNTGSAKLNARAEADTSRLAAFLETTNMTGKEVLFVGFTDSVGKSELNAFLSKNRAELVMESVLAASPDIGNRVNIRAVGFGEIAPVGCNESNRGRTINRRVEVWVRDVPA